ncbi:MAG: TetR/AcrR family transcriptional regulator [Gammaproteobacteria bacterium]|nr:TetR/AcrR family transcriptional regulator [Gammaproteobacteria bacterium]
MSERKQQILEHAAELVATVGFDSFSYNDLSERLGITKASLHHHFPKKEDLGLSLLDQMIAFKEQIRDELLQVADTPLHRLLAYLAFYREICADANCSQICPISSLQAEINVIPESMRDKLKILDEIESRMVTDLLTEGRSSGEMSFAGEPAHHAMMLISAIKGALQFSRSHGIEVVDNTITQLKFTLGLKPD